MFPDAWSEPGLNLLLMEEEGRDTLSAIISSSYLLVENNQTKAEPSIPQAFPQAYRIFFKKSTYVKKKTLIKKIKPNFTTA